MPQPGGTENGQSLFLKNICNTGHQGPFGTHNSQINLILLGKCCKGVDVFSTDIHILSQGCGACIAWGTVYFIYKRALGDFPDQGMFPAAAADDKNFHWALLKFVLLFSSMASSMSLSMRTPNS